MKLMIWVGAAIGGAIGGWLGAALLDGGDWLGGWSIMLSFVGTIIGIWAGYKFAKNSGY